MMARLTEAYLINRALEDGIGWQEGLVDSFNDAREPMAVEAASLAKAYRALLKKRTGDDRTDIEKRTAGMTKISIWEIARRAALKEGPSE